VEATRPHESLSKLKRHHYPELVLAHLESVAPERFASGVKLSHGAKETVRSTL
jgi:hypothetical protein